MNPVHLTLLSSLIWLSEGSGLLKWMFDIRVTDTDASSYGDQTPMAILKRAKAEKKEKYLKACEEKMALFTSLCYCGGYVRTRGFPFP